MRQAQLFPDLEPNPLLPISESDALARVIPLASDLHDLIAGAFDDTLALVGFGAERGVLFDDIPFANIFHSCVIAHAQRKLGPRADVVVVNEGRLLISAYEVNIQIKKLARDGYPSSNKTRASVSIVRQLFSDYPMLTLGVNISQARDRILSVDIMCMRDTKKEWWRTALPTSTVANTEAKPINPSPSDQGRRNRYKRKDAGNRKDADTASSAEGSGTSET